MTDYLSVSESPLLQWWRENHLLVNEACLAASFRIADADAKRRLFKQAIQRDLSIDDRRLRGVVGYLIRQNSEALEIIQQHRKWAKARGGEL